jgi:hypothetical protein
LITSNVAIRLADLRASLQESRDRLEWLTANPTVIGATKSAKLACRKAARLESRIADLEFEIADGGRP